MNDFDKLCFHVYSDGKRADIPFGTDVLKIYAMNSIAIVACIAGVRVLCLIVGDTHLHVVIYGTRKSAEVFRVLLKSRIARHYTINGMSDLLGDGFFLVCDPIQNREETMAKIIYTLRNSLDFSRQMPWEYRWGVGNLYFTQHLNVYGNRIGDLSYRKLCRLFHTEVKIPKEWLYDDSGMIMPASYVDYEFVERLFGSPRAFIAFLYVRKEDEQKMKEQLNARYLEERSIEDLRKIANKLCISTFGRVLRNTTIKNRIKVAAAMLNNHTATKSESLAKAVFLNMEDLTRLL
ncbi:MAG: hypothetical protein J5737_07250 [Bacteroidales bacterium]|nr:hypothetical protein [Bacteroidales bacterium]